MCPFHMHRKDCSQLMEEDGIAPKAFEQEAEFPEVS